MAEQYNLPLLATLPLDPAFLAECEQKNSAAAFKNSAVFQDEFVSFLEKLG